MAGGWLEYSGGVEALKVLQIEELVTQAFCVFLCVFVSTPMLSHAAHIQIYRVSLKSFES